MLADLERHAQEMREDFGQPSHSTWHFHLTLLSRSAKAETEAETQESTSSTPYDEGEY